MTNDRKQLILEKLAGKVKAVLRLASKSKKGTSMLSPLPPDFRLAIRDGGFHPVRGFDDYAVRSLRRGRRSFLGLGPRKVTTSQRSVEGAGYSDRTLREIIGW